MSIYQCVKDAMASHGKKIELIQWGMTQTIASLVYSKYIQSFRQKAVPVPMVLVPSIRNLEEFLRMDDKFMEMISNQLIDRITSDTRFMEYVGRVPELVMFNTSNVEILKTVMDLYILPNVSRRIVSSTKKKFQLGEETQQTFRESNDISIFRDDDLNNGMVKYLADEFIAGMLLLCPTIPREVEVPESNEGNFLAENEILSINNDHALCPVHFTESIIENKDVHDLLVFVTNSQFTRIDTGEICCQKDDRINQFRFTTGIFNQVTITRIPEPNELSILPAAFTETSLNDVGGKKEEG